MKYVIKTQWELTRDGVTFCGRTDAFAAYIYLNGGTTVDVTLNGNGGYVIKRPILIGVGYADEPDAKCIIKQDTLDKFFIKISTVELDEDLFTL